MRHCTTLTKPRIWIITEHFLAKFNEVFPDSASQPQLILFDSKSGYTSVTDLIKIGQNNQFIEPISANPLEEIAFIQFSSGTTGPPKGVALTNFNYIAARTQNL